MKTIINTLKNPKEVKRIATDLLIIVSPTAFAVIVSYLIH